MDRFLLIAVRNVLRHRRRSALTAGSILVGVAMIVFGRGFANGFVQAVARTAVEAKVGALQVHRRGWRDADRDVGELAIPLGEDLDARLRAVPGVVATAPRIVFEALLGNGVTNAPVLVTAVDPESEARVCPARFAPASATAAIVSGDLDAALVGSALAEALGAAAGGTLTLLAAGADGGSNALDVTVKGLVAATTPFDAKRVVVLPLGRARELLGLGGRATEIALSIDNLARTDVIADRVRRALGPDYEVTTWFDEMPIVLEAQLRLRAVLGVVTALLFVLVLAGVWNTMLMAVYERVREIGTMMAVGVRRRGVMALFLLESAWLGVLGGGVGAGLGGAAVAVLGRAGLTIRPPGTSAALEIHPFVSLPFVALAVAVAAAGALLAAAYPSWRASRLTPVEALRAL